MVHTRRAGVLPRLIEFEDDKDAGTHPSVDPYTECDTQESRTN